MPEKAFSVCIKDSVFIDPSAGSGTFLIEYMKFITENMKYRFRSELGSARAVKDKIESDWFYPDHRENKWAQTYIYASESNFNLGTATKVNMILHGDGSTNIFVKDGLLPFTYYQKETAPNVMHDSKDEPLYFDKAINGNFDLILTNPPFAYYYLRSKYFQYLIEVYKKGLQNQNIFPIVMQEFPIPDISLPEQQRIVDEIQAEIDNQEQIKAEIASLRNQIDEVINVCSTIRC